jgi:hypothetical protein
MFHILFQHRLALVNINFMVVATRNFKDKRFFAILGVTRELCMAKNG